VPPMEWNTSVPAVDALSKIMGDSGTRCPLPFSAVSIDGSSGNRTAATAVARFRQGRRRNRASRTQSAQTPVNPWQHRLTEGKVARHFRMSMARGRKRVPERNLSLIARSLRSGRARQTHRGFLAPGLATVDNEAGSRKSNARVNRVPFRRKDRAACRALCKCARLCKLLSLYPRAAPGHRNTPDNRGSPGCARGW
jgi:hypothetical protein